MPCARCRHDKKIRARKMCEACYQHCRRRDHYTGSWESSYIDPEPVLAHIEALTQAGITRRQIKKLTGFSRIYQLAPGNPIHRRPAEAILAIEIPVGPSPVVAERSCVPAVGTSRRLQALAVMGWSIYYLANRLDIGRSHLYYIAHQLTPTVQAKTARSVANLYDELAMIDGPRNKTRQAAIGRGWYPPLAWDDDQIDDPEASPTGVGIDRRLTFVEAYSELRQLGYDGDEEIAARMGIEVKSLQRQLTPSRHGKVSA